jgi:hypothetical protein
MQSEGDIFGFCDILRISIPIFSGTKKEKKIDFIPLESPCDSE